MLKKFINRYFPLLPVLAILAAALHAPSCANTTEAPTGGDRDTLPPVLRRISPLPGTTQVPVSGARIVFTFDEYVVIKDAKSIFLSPPATKLPKAKIKGKSVVITFPADLDSNTTYALDISNAIADNNEGNLFPGFTFVFSTGKQIDSMMVTGLVQNATSLNPVKGATVMLYKDPSDSAVFLKRPVAAVKTDDWGYFCLRNIQDTLFRMYAIKDANGNNQYDPDEDLIAFMDTLIRPVVKVNDTLPELMKYDMKDTALCQARKVEYELSLFREKPSRQMIMNKVRTGDRSAYITFNAPNAQIDSMWFRGFPGDALIMQSNVEGDSIEVWLNSRKPAPDTLHLFVNYHKTDSLGRLFPTVEHVKLYQEGVGGRKLRSKSAKKTLQHKDTICAFTLTAEPERVEQYGFEMEFKLPPIYEDFAGMTFRYLNPKQKESVGTFKWERDSLNLRKYTIRPDVKYLPGYEYFLKVPHRRFRDINGYLNDSTEVKVTLPTNEDLSSLTLKCVGVHNKYIIDLFNEKRDKILRTYIIDRDTDLLFPYLKEGTYAIRITEDVNKNGIVDTGSLLEHRQPEQVKFLKMNDKPMIDILPRAEVEQDLDLSELFRPKTAAE